MTDYFSNPALSYSKLKVLDESPPLFYRRFFLGEEQELTDALRFGSAWDDYMTNQSEFKKLWKVKETETTKLPGHITTKELNLIKKMTEAVNTFDNFTEDSPFKGFSLERIFALSIKQKEIFWHNTEFSLQLKAKLDYLLHVKDIVSFFDLKSTKEITREGVTKSFFNFKYYLQAAMYSSGLKQTLGLDYYPDGYYVFCSKVTYQVFMFKISFDVLTYGLSNIDRLLNKYVDYEKNNKWFQHDQCSEIELPRWLK